MQLIIRGDSTNTEAVCPPKKIGQLILAVLLCCIFGQIVVWGRLA
jgi:hypothetical protein